MRYSDVSIDFWLVVMELFKSRGLRFFRRLMADAQKQAIMEGNY